MRRLPVILLPALAAAPLAAQDTTVTKDQPIRIGVDYAANRPGLVVLPGAGLDSARAIVRRDLDYTDRFIIWPPPRSRGWCRQCGHSCDVIGFVMELWHCDFVTAVQKIAHEYLQVGPEDERELV